MENKLVIGKLGLICYETDKPPGTLLRPDPCVLGYAQPDSKSKQALGAVSRVTRLPNRKAPLCLIERFDSIHHQQLTRRRIYGYQHRPGEAGK